MWLCLSPTRRSPRKQERPHSLLAVRTSHLVPPSRALVKLVLQRRVSNSLHSPGLHVAPDATARLPQAAGTLPAPLHSVPGGRESQPEGAPAAEHGLSHNHTQRSSRELTGLVGQGGSSAAAWRGVWPRRLRPGHRPGHTCAALGALPLGASGVSAQSPSRAPSPHPGFAPLPPTAESTPAQGPAQRHVTDH